MQPILYQNVECSVTLIDIPTSIAAAQGALYCRVTDTLLSSRPQEEPFPSPEPKTPVAATKIVKNTVDQELHLMYKGIIEKALAEIRQNVHGRWCLTRKLMQQTSSNLKERKANTASSAGAGDLENMETKLSQALESLQDQRGGTGGGISSLVPSLSPCSEPGSGKPDSWVMSYVAIDHEDEECLQDGGTLKKYQELWEPSFHNASNELLEVSVFEASNPSAPSTSPLVFKIPPRATFFLHDCTQPGSFRAEFRDITQDYDLPLRFDFILLDPPWPNSSVRRRSAYVTQPTVNDIKKMILRMDLDTYMKRSGLVGIWITNKPALRSMVLGPGGLFERLGVSLIEEWIWIKTTASGEPVFSLDSAWRKPYEVLLLGRVASDPWIGTEAVPDIQRRVIAGVPDLHSRKPCLKELIGLFMPETTEYSALEIFSRYLVAGWCSWGNEVLKFNWQGYWVTASLEESTYLAAEMDYDMEQ
ncbi:MT-A70-domain-containing protein [Glonium stellatum]|uniref:MT-A70-domain-containing protein n=1 Tax=Glonium stellatum TaxID=574774 RepID=A0A8E2JRW8_9PEZI|nr:MT-A70-domain-containing protein [Glonium stellatum]